MRHVLSRVLFCISLTLFLALAAGNDTEKPDHRAHSVPGPDQTKRDEDGDGFAEITLNGELSHTHYFVPGPPAVVGRLVSYEWKDNNLGAIIGTNLTVTYNFPVGETVVTLTVVDNSGDTSSNDVKVTVLPSGNQGAYMYFYDLSAAAINTNKIPKIPPAEYGMPVEQIDFKIPQDFPKNVPFLTEGPFAIQVSSEYLAVLDDEYVFFVSHGGGAVELVIDDKRVLRKLKTDTNETLSVTSPVSLKKGKHVLNLVYYTPDPSKAQLILGINLNGGVQAVPNSFLSYESGVVLPTIHKVTPEKTTLGGGGKITISGAGFTSGSSVKIGSYKVQEVYVKSENLLEIRAPTADAPEDVLIQVETSRGVSNTKHFSFTKAALMPIKFREMYVKNEDGSNFESKQFTSVAIGPDLRYYFGSLDTHVHVLTIRHSTLVVQKSCKSESVGGGRSITGVSFNPGEKRIRVYISTNTFYYRNWKLMSDEDGWHNGKIEALVPFSKSEDPEVCLKHEKDVVTGLPVSNHDHGVNSLVWDNDGNLYAQIGGTTNAGYSTPDDLVGGVPESVLSAATIIVHIRAPGFDGNVTYDQYKDPGTAKQTSPTKFVEGFGFGFRNSYGSVFHSNGHIYATDNGPNLGYGKKSMTCDTVGDDPWHPDTLVLVHKDSYFGFPNRARGALGDPRQCVYYDPRETSRNGFTAALATFEASTNGLIEYTANTFEGQLKGDLLASKYAVGGNGKLYRIALDATGTSVMGKVEELAKYSALSIAMNPFGSLIMPRVQQPNIAVLVPDEEVNDKMKPVVTAVFPNRGRMAGGNRVAITGRFFEKGASVTIGDVPAEVTRISSSHDWILCKVPAGSGSVKVVVSTSIGTSVAMEEDYHYLSY